MPRDLCGLEQQVKLSGKLSFDGQCRPDQPTPPALSHEVGTRFQGHPSGSLGIWWLDLANLSL